MKIAFIGFGEAARTFVGTLRTYPEAAAQSLDVTLASDAA